MVRAIRVLWDDKTVVRQVEAVLLKAQKSNDGGTGQLIASDAAAIAGGDCARVHEFEVRVDRVCVGDHTLRPYRLAVLQRHTSHLTTRDHDLFDPSLK